MNKLDQRLDFPSDATLKEKFRQSAAVQAAIGKPEVNIQNLSADAVREVFGPFDASDFDGIASMAPFFAHKQNIIRKILDEEKAS